MTDDPTPAQRQLRQAQAKLLANRFETLWWQLNGPELEAEYRFHPVRRWRADFAHLPSRTLIELEGGIWQRGRHNRARGYQRDCSKYNAATMLGWRVLRLATGMVDVEHIEPIIEWIEEES